MRKEKKFAKELTEDENIELIDGLLDIYVKEQEEMRKSDPTFFQIINRTHDEDLISRMLAYILRKDENLVWELLKFYGTTSGNRPTGFKIKAVRCEKPMLNGRADIFVEAFDNIELYTLTIENKIYSWEQGNQTQTYYNYVSREYQFSGNEKYKNAYLFLKPEFNASPVSCKQFKSITYKELLEKISDNNDYIIKDFKKHIEEFLSVKEIKFTDTNKQVLKNIPELRVILESAEKQLTTFKGVLFRELCNGRIKELEYNPYTYDGYKKDKEKSLNYKKEYEGKDVLVAYVDDGSESKHKDNCLKIYKNKWKYAGGDTADNYHFYVEIIFRDNNPNKIEFQKVVQRYDLSKKDISIVSKFVNSPIFKEKINEGHWDGNPEYWYVFKTDVFSNDNMKIEGYHFSKKWQEELLIYAETTLNKYIEEMENIFGVFENFRDTQTN